MSSQQACSIASKSASCFGDGGEDPPMELFVSRTLLGDSPKSAPGVSFVRPKRRPIRPKEVGGWTLGY